MIRKLRSFSENARTRWLDGARRLRDMTVGAVLTGGNPTWALRATHPARVTAALAGRTVLVSGASSGIGRAVALKAADAGAHVVLVARSADRLRCLEAEIRRRGGRARSYAVDLSSTASTNELLSQLAAAGVVVDVLVNNAGRSIRRSIGESSDRLHDFERTMALNYFGSLRLILALLPDMRARRHGHVINVSSAGAQMSTPLFSAYVASKAALDAFTRVAASEAQVDGVCFTTVYMPLVRTPMIAPTRAYRDAPALTPEQAADLVLRPLVTHERELGMGIAKLFHLAHVAAPGALEAMLGWGHRLLAEAEQAPDEAESPRAA
jgi:short-subunit dehydrogenase